MARLVAICHTDPLDQLRAIDDAWRDGDAVAVLDATAPLGLRDAALAALQPDITHVGDTTTGSNGPGVPDGTALVVMTSGSTGTPTAVLLAHEALAASTAASRERLAAEDGVPWLGVLPLHHVAGISVVLRSRAAGVEPSGLQTRDWMGAITTAPRSWLSLVPTQLARILAADGGGDALAAHAGVLLGGAATPPALLERAASAGVHVVTSYGSTQTSGGCVYDGRPLDGIEVQADAAGVLSIRGPVVATGTRAADGAITPLVDADGWYRTDDLGEVDAGGTVVIHGRADAVVVSGGENVPLPAVEAALRALGLFADVAVVGLPDATYGTAVTAVVVPLDTDAAAEATASLTALRTLLEDRLPTHHRPTKLVVTAELPRTALGKVTPASVLAAVHR